MMRRVEMLPARYIERRRQNRLVRGIAVVGIVLLVLVVGWWFLLDSQIGDREDELADIQARNAQLQVQIDELQRFAQLEQEVNTKEEALRLVMTGDVDWPRVMTELAMVVPGEIWLTNLTASAAVLEGGTTVGTETAPVRISEETPFGRIQFTGNSLSMPGVAKWLIRLATVEEFEAIWLNSATGSEGETAATSLFSFDNTIELNSEAASNRFQEGLE
jgi:Tfp pilus assembly protein PilN